MSLDISALESSGIWNDIKEDGETCWVVCGTSENPQKLEIQASGSGGLDEVLAALQDDQVSQTNSMVLSHSKQFFQVQYGGFRVTAVDARGGRVR